MIRHVQVTTCDICGHPTNCRRYRLDRLSAPSVKKTKALDLCPEHAEAIEAILHVDLRKTPAPKTIVHLDRKKARA